MQHSLNAIIITFGHTETTVHISRHTDNCTHFTLYRQLYTFHVIQTTVHISRHTDNCTHFTSSQTTVHISRPHRQLYTFHVTQTTVHITRPHRLFVQNICSDYCPTHAQVSQEPFHQMFNEKFVWLYLLSHPRARHQPRITQYLLTGSTLRLRRKI